MWQDVLVFAPLHNLLPNPRNQYDIVRLHRIYVRLRCSLLPALPRLGVQAPHDLGKGAGSGAADRRAAGVQVQEFNNKPQFVCRAGKTASFCLFDGQPQAREAALVRFCLAVNQPLHA